MKRIFLLCFLFSVLFFRLSLGYASENIEKFVKYFESLGTVKLVMVNDIIKTAETYLELILINTNGKSEVLWKTSSDKNINNIQEVNIYKYAQIIDINLKKDECSFLVSTSLGVKYIFVRKKDGIWDISSQIIINEISNNMNLIKIALVNFDLVLTDNKLGEEVIYKIDSNGNIIKFVKQEYINKNPRSKEIIIK